MRHKLLFSFFIFLIVALPIRSKDFVLTSGQTVVIACSPSEELVVRTALEMLGRDIQTVLSSTTQANEKTGEIVIGTVGQSELISRTDIDVSALKGKKQAFLLSVSPEGKLIVAGSDKHGTAYGILEISRLLGVSPWEWWADVTPEKKTSFVLSAEYQTLQSPSVEYRGIFINDEDWGLMPWSSQTYEPSDIKGHIGPKTNARIFELLLRLRANTYWPAMHECTLPFFLTEGNRKVAEEYGIFIGSSHCEPMVCSAAGEWRRRGQGDYDYVNNSASVYKFWEDRVKEVAQQGNIYTLGMRGVHDGQMQGAKTVAEQKAVLERVLKDQRGLLQKYVNKDVTAIPQAFIPYKEVLDIYNAGLQVPDDVTLIWCDDNYGYIRHFPTAEERARKGGNGIYYHVSYWGRPHDYLWLGTFSPYLLHKQMKLAYDRGIQKMWVLNVGDIKPAEYQIELFLDMAWNIDEVNEIGVTAHLKSWLGREFGSNCAEELLPAMEAHYQLSYIRKPEFMGNTREEERDPKYKVIKDLPWSEQTISERLRSYTVLSDVVERMESNIPTDRQDAYFQLVKYPFLLVFQYSIAALFVRKNPFKLLGKMMPAYFTALGTQSSAATIPVTLEQTKKNGVSSDIAGFVIPLCATIHLSGSTLKIVACALALMMMQGIPFDFPLFAGFIFMLGITMVAAPGVPGGAIMAALGILQSMLGFDESAQALMIALYIAMDSFGTACNVTGDGAIALIIDKIMGKNRAERLC